MTTIAIRDGVIAADTQGNWNGDTSFHYNKLASTKSYLIGFTGSFALSSPMYEWITALDEKGVDPLHFWKHRDLLSVGDEKGMTIMLDHNHKIWAVYPSGATCPLLGSFEAVGSGSRFAIGAMHAGATAVQAVEAAIAYDDGTGGLVRHMQFGGEPVPPFSS